MTDEPTTPTPKPLRCSICAEWKPPSDFPLRRSAKTGRDCCCKPCKAAYEKDRRAKKRAEAQAKRRSEAQYQWSKHKDPATGHFLPGNPGGPGRPTARNEERWYGVIAAVVTEHDLADITEFAIIQAKRGNRFARDWLCHYLIGKPRQMVEFSGSESPILRLLSKWLGEDEQESKSNDSSTAVE